MEPLVPSGQSVRPSRARRHVGLGDADPGRFDAGWPINSPTSQVELAHAPHRAIGVLLPASGGGRWLWDPVTGCHPAIWIFPVFDLRTVAVEIEASSQPTPYWWPRAGDSGHQPTWEVHLDSQLMADHPGRIRSESDPVGESAKRSAPG